MTAEARDRYSPPGPFFLDAPVAQSVDAAVSKAGTCEFESRQEHQEFCPRSPMVAGARFKSGVSVGSSPSGGTSTPVTRVRIPLPPQGASYSGHYTGPSLGGSSNGRARGRLPRDRSSILLPPTNIGLQLKLVSFSASEPDRESPQGLTSTDDRSPISHNAPVAHWTRALGYEPKEEGSIPSGGTIFRRRVMTIAASLQADMRRGDTAEESRSSQCRMLANGQAP